MKPMTDIYGFKWNLPESELCPVCKQPGGNDCTHKRLDDVERAVIKQGLTYFRWFTPMQ